jgi:hypothetical protein
MQKTILLLFAFVIGHLYAQTNISGGNVFGKWTKSNSPYRINGNITIPKDSTLTIEAGVSIQFGPRKHLKVDGRILAMGRAKSTDSIWFTRQNTHDTNFWRGIKFINTSNSNDTSIFKHCVFRDCKNPYDTTRLYKGGCISLFNYGKVKVAYSTFYNNGSGDGGCLLISDNSFARIQGCTFKNNAANRYYYWDGTFYQEIAGTRGSAIYIRNNSNCLIDSCLFKNNSRGLQFKPQPSINYESTTVYVAGSLYLNQKCYATITNSIFDGNEGIMLCAMDRAIVNVNNCSFINAPFEKSLNVILSTERAEVFTRNCSFQNNQSNIIIYPDNGKYYSFNDLMSNNLNFFNLYTLKGSYGYASLTNTKVLNNKANLAFTYSGLVRVEKATGCLFANNECPRFLMIDYMYNSTVVNNYCSVILIDCINTSYDFKNNVIWGNRCDSANSRQITARKDSKVAFKNNIIENDSHNFYLTGNYTYTNSLGMPIVYFNNFSANPQFVNPTASYGVNYNAANADFSLKSTCSVQSPGINAGHPDTLYLKLPLKDLNGNPRFFENKIDIGAYENNSGSPEVIILSQTPKDSFCEKSRAAQLSVSAIGKGISYQWQQSVNAGNSWTNINNETSHQLTKNNTKSSQNNMLYRALLTGDCDADTSQTMQIITFDLPEVNLGKDTGICDGNTLVKTISSNVTYLWHTGNTSNTLNQTIHKDTTWWVQITNPKGCRNRDTLKIKHHVFPVVNLGEDKSLHKDESLTLDAGSGASAYLWNNGLTTQTRNFKGQDLGDIGTYVLWAQATNSHGCSDRDSVSITVLGFTSVKALNKEIIKIFPQPAKDILNVEIPDLILNNNVSFTLKSIDGKLIHKQTINQTQTIISIEDLESGIYIIVLKIGNQNYTHKCIKE